MCPYTYSFFFFHHGASYLISSLQSKIWSCFYIDMSWEDLKWKSNHTKYTCYLRTRILKAVVAEWLRRWTRNPLGSARAGSNPADCACFALSDPVLRFKYLCGFSRNASTNSRTIMHNCLYCCRGRVVKAMDSKSIGLCPHRFESCRQRSFWVRLRRIKSI